MLKLCLGQSFGTLSSRSSFAQNLLRALHNKIPRIPSFTENRNFKEFIGRVFSLAPTVPFDLTVAIEPLATGTVPYAVPFVMTFAV